MVFDFMVCMKKKINKINFNINDIDSMLIKNEKLLMKSTILFRMKEKSRKLDI
jgi:hypothetical protein